MQCLHHGIEDHRCLERCGALTALGVSQADDSAFAWGDLDVRPGKAQHFSGSEKPIEPCRNQEGDVKVLVLRTSVLSPLPPQLVTAVLSVTVLLSELAVTLPVHLVLTATLLAMLVFQKS